MGLAGIYDFPTAIHDNEDTGTRLTNQLLALLAQFDIAASVDASGRLPLKLRGPKLGMPADLTLPPDSPLAKATLLFAALGVRGISSFVEPAPGWDHAERMLSQFGADLTISSEGSGKRIEVAGLQSLKAQQIAVPADPSLAALGAVAASIVPASEILIENVLVNPARTAMLSALVALGARIEAHNLRTVHGEEVADLSVRHEGMKGIALGAQHIGTVIDELPLLAVAAAFAEGETTFHLPPNLPLLDRARLAGLGRGLALCGVKAEAEEETFSVHGTSDVKGGATVVADDDAVMALALLVLGMGAREQVTIADQSVIEKRFPGFVERFENIGASFIRDADAIGEDRGE
jgi:3-phosphoshikimate 1-carboxyvinyltransferase